MPEDRRHADPRRRVRRSEQRCDERKDAATASPGTRGLGRLDSLIIA